MLLLTSCQVQEKEKSLCNAYICNLFRIQVNQRKKKVTENYIVRDFFNCGVCHEDRLQWWKQFVTIAIFAGWCTDTCTHLSVTQQTVTCSTCCWFCRPVPLVVAVSPWAVPQRSHPPPSGHSVFKGPRETKLVPCIAELCPLALAATRARTLRRLLLWHSEKEGKVKWAPLPSFAVIQRNQADRGHSWITEEIPCHSLEGRGWNTDHSPHFPTKQLLPQPIEYTRISHASFWHSGQERNSLLWSLIQRESHVLKQKWNIQTCNNQPLIYQAYQISFLSVSFS